MKLKKTILDKNGFTILELLIALSIFAIGILGVARMQLQSTTGNTSARKVSEASEFGQEQVELTMAIPYSNLNIGTTQTVSNNYTVTRVISNAKDSDGNDIAGIFEIEVTVTDPSGVERTSYRFTKPQNM